MTQLGEHHVWTPGFIVFFFSSRPRTSTNCSSKPSIGFYPVAIRPFISYFVLPPHNTANLQFDGSPTFTFYIVFAPRKTVIPSHDPSTAQIGVPWGSRTTSECLIRFWIDRVLSYFTSLSCLPSSSLISWASWRFFAVYECKSAFSNIFLHMHFHAPLQILHPPSAAIQSSSRRTSFTRNSGSSLPLISPDHLQWNRIPRAQPGESPPVLGTDRAISQDTPATVQWCSVL